jgi:hypothetical protein
LGTTNLQFEPHIASDSRISSAVCYVRHALDKRPRFPGFVTNFSTTSLYLCSTVDPCKEKLTMLGSCSTKDDTIGDSELPSLLNRRRLARNALIISCISYSGVSAAARPSRVMGNQTLPPWCSGSVSIWHSSALIRPGRHLWSAPHAPHRIIFRFNCST